ncbi:MAG: HlyD family efflux transporter periplasmic adaptor subunit [Flavobacteriales bacterium]|nr:HlyD family efflux transporter periplasmic adaptor subunit [Flavobacteriales bacterium]
MDRVIERSWWSRKGKWVWLGLGLGGFILLLVWLSLSGRHLEVDLSKLKTSTVKYGDFQEVFIANGSAEPKMSVLFDAGEGGIIEEILVEEGQSVKAGDILFKLNNERLSLDYMQRETQMVEQINNLRNTRINLGQNTRLTEDQLDDFLLQFNSAENQFRIDSSLHMAGAIPDAEYFSSELNYEYLKDRVEVLEARQNSDQKYHKDQVSRIDRSIGLMERNLELIRAKLKEMSVKAPISGQLNSFSVELGQVLQPNQTIGRVDVPDVFWVRASIDQHYLSRLQVGQTGRIEYNRQSYDLQVSKVNSTIENGQIEVFLEFISEPPVDLRRGQRFQISVQVSAIKSANMLAKGAFYQSSGGQYVYVVDRESGTAHKQAVKLGTQNPQYYEVLEGIDEGQEVIISSYNTFEESDKLKFRNN